MKRKDGYSKQVLSFILLIFTQSCTPMPQTPGQDMQYVDYKLISCKEHEAGLVVWFATNDEKSTRHFALSKLDNTLVVGFSGGKGVVDWSDVETITYSKLNDAEGYVSIEFDRPYSFISWRKYKVLEFGVMSVECWRVLEATVNGEIRTEIIEG